MDGKETYSPWTDTETGEEIVISGIAGRFPDSDNVSQLRENLFNRVDLVRADHDRWKTEHPEIPSRMGTVNNVDKFDADFFGLSFEQAHILAPEARMLVEHSYEAIIDAGINPKRLREKNTAVIIGTSFLDVQEKLMYEGHQISDMSVIGGCNKSITVNMISCHLDLKGPSYTVDTACSSSLYAMALGYHYIMSGKYKDAVVGTANLCFQPIINLQFSRLY